MRLHAAWATDVGRVRTGNEDALLIDDRLGVFAVADGMGGHVAGEVASSTAVEAVRAAIAGGSAIDEAIRAANAAVRDRAAEDPALTGMGTTLTAVVPLDGSRVLIGHVGDSRAYLLRGGQLTRLTDDHSLVEELVRDGRITAEQAEAHPQRSIITRAIGVEAEIDVDVYTIEVSNGDRILICSDGLSDMLRDAEVARVADTSADASTAADRLVAAANDAGGGDNITVVVLDVAEVDDEPAVIDHLAEPQPLGAALAEPAPPATEPAAPARRGRMRRAVSIALVVVPVVVIASVGVGFAWWRATHTYFVGESRGVVAIYRGVPGGLLVWDPSIVERTDLKTGTLEELERARVRDGFCEGSRAEAEACVQELRDRRAARPATTTSARPTTSSSPRSTSSSVPRTSTVAATTQP
jgi:protein phosphatase